VASQAQAKASLDADLEKAVAELNTRDEELSTQTVALEEERRLYRTSIEVDAIDAAKSQGAKIDIQQAHQAATIALQEADEARRVALQEGEDHKRIMAAEWGLLEAKLKECEGKIVEVAAKEATMWETQGDLEQEKAVVEKEKRAVELMLAAFEKEKVTQLKEESRAQRSLTLEAGLAECDKNVDSLLPYMDV